MKNFTFSLLFLSSLLFSYSFSVENYFSSTLNTQNESATCKYGQCKSIAKSTGKRCKHCVSNSGNSYCFQHK